MNRKQFANTQPKTEFACPLIAEEERAVFAMDDEDLLIVLRPRARSP